jgi:hypothetical protein
MEKRQNKTRTYFGLKSLNCPSMVEACKKMEELEKRVAKSPLKLKGWVI